MKTFKFDDVIICITCVPLFISFVITLLSRSYIPIYFGLFFCFLIILNLYLLYQYKKHKIEIFVKLIKSNKVVNEYFQSNLNKSFKINYENLDLDVDNFFIGLLFNSAELHSSEYVKLNNLCDGEYDFGFEYYNWNHYPLKCLEYKALRNKFIKSINSEKILPFKLTPSYLFYGIHFYNLDLKKQMANQIKLDKLKNEENQVLEDKKTLSEFENQITIPKFYN